MGVLLIVPLPLRGRDRGGVESVEDLGDCSGDTIAVGQNIMVPESYQAIALRGQP
jgi:hypothetical protein